MAAILPYQFKLASSSSLVQLNQASPLGRNYLNEWICDVTNIRKKCAVVWRTQCRCSSWIVFSVKENIFDSVLDFEIVAFKAAGIGAVCLLIPGYNETDFMISILTLSVTLHTPRDELSFSWISEWMWWHWPSHPLLISEFTAVSCCADKAVRRRQLR